MIPTVHDNPPLAEGLISVLIRGLIFPLRRGPKPMAIRIKSRHGESVNQMLRRFKKLCEKEGLTKDVKRKQYFEKPSERRRRAMRKAIARVQRLNDPQPQPRPSGGRGGSDRSDRSGGPGGGGPRGGGR
jgi:small subunit ribosomal protein S21